MARLILVGTYDFTLDAKNRVCIPAVLRAAFTTGIYVTKWHERCLAGWAPDQFENQLDRQAEEISRLSSKGRQLMRFNTANAVFQQPDGQGRIILSPRHLEHAGIGKDVTIIGVNDHIEIWDREAYATYEAGMGEGVDATADELATL